MLFRSLADAEEANDWEARFTIDLKASRETGRVLLALDSVGPVGA